MIPSYDQGTGGAWVGIVDAKVRDWVAIESVEAVVQLLKGGVRTPTP